MADSKPSHTTFPVSKATPCPPIGTASYTSGIRKVEAAPRMRDTSKEEDRVECLFFVEEAHLQPPRGSGSPSFPGSAPPKKDRFV